jgi:hypothetical protein
MTTRNAADGEGHGEQRKAKGQGDAREPDPKVREGRRKHGAAAPAQNEPKRTDEFGGAPFRKRHILKLLIYAYNE